MLRPIRMSGFLRKYRRFIPGVPHPFGGASCCNHRTSCQPFIFRYLQTRPWNIGPLFVKCVLSDGTDLDSFFVFWITLGLCICWFLSISNIRFRAGGAGFYLGTHSDGGISKLNFGSRWRYHGDFCVHYVVLHFLIERRQSSYLGVCVCVCVGLCMRFLFASICGWKGLSMCEPYMLSRPCAFLYKLIGLARNNFVVGVAAAHYLPRSGPVGAMLRRTPTCRRGFRSWASPSSAPTRSCETWSGK